MQRSIIFLLATMALLVQSTLVLASGGSSGGGFGRSGGGFGNNQPVRQVDQTYEAGKAIFKGRQRGEPSLQYCIAVGDEKLPVKRKSVKGYKKATYNEFANNLYQCDEPEKRIAESLTRDSLLYVIYYLNKRHKLALRGS